jgi:hypothetical protein
LTHRSLGDGLSDGGGTVTGRANDIVARLSSAADSGWRSLTCLYHLHVSDLARTLKESELSLERLLSPSDTTQLPSPTHLTRNHALIFHISIPCHNGLDNDDYFSIAPVTLHETLMFQWRIIRYMHSEEAVSERDAAFDRLILHWILSPSSLCFALSSNRQYPQVAEAYLQALFSGGYGYDVIKFGDSLFLHACIKLDDAVSTLHLFALGLPSDVLPRPFLPVNDASKCSSSKCNNNGCCLDKRFARWSRRRSTRLSLKHIIAAITCWLVVAFRDRTFFLLSLTPPRTFKFHSSVCNILLGIHLSWYVDGLDSGRVLLHPNPVFCQSSHECMSQPDRDVIWPNRGKSSNGSNISTLKDLSINLCME